MLGQLLHATGSTERTVDAVHRSGSADRGQSGGVFAEQLAGEKHRRQQRTPETEVGKALPPARGKASPPVGERSVVAGGKARPGIENSLPVTSGQTDAAVAEQSTDSVPVMSIRDMLSQHLDPDEVDTLLEQLSELDLESPLVAVDEGQWLGVSDADDAVLLTIDLDNPQLETSAVTVLSMEDLLAGLADSTQMTLASEALADHSMDSLQSVTDVMHTLFEQLAALAQQDAEPLHDWQADWLTADPVAMLTPSETGTLAAWLPNLQQQEINSIFTRAAESGEFSATAVSEELAVALGLLDGDAQEDVDPDLKPGDDESRRSRSANTETLLSRLVGDNAREGSRTVASEDGGLLRPTLEPGNPRELNRQTTLDLARSHVERELAVKNSAGELTQRLSERLVVMIGQDIQEARIRLDPPELGRMDVKITTQNDQVQVQIIAQQPIVRDLLEQHANRLREMLEQQGFAQVDVDVSDQGWQGEQSDENATDGGNGNGGTNEPEGEGVADVVARPLGLVDHYV